MIDYDTAYGHIPEKPLPGSVEETNDAFRKLQAEFDALHDDEKKELCDMMFEHVENIIWGACNNLKYTEPLRVIGIGDYKI